MQWMVDAINRLGTLESVQALDSGRLEAVVGPGTTLADAARAVLGDKFGDAERRYFEAWPPSLQEAIRAALYDAARRGRRIQVQWAPGYDFEVSMWEAPSGKTPGGLIMQFRSPYPADIQ